MRETFASHGSSLDNAHQGTQFRCGQTFRMNLPMTIRVDKHTIFRAVAPAHHAPDDVVVMPPRQGRDALVADGADALLFAPKVTEPSATMQGGGHLDAEAFFQIDFPSRVVGVTVALDRRCGLQRRRQAGQRQRHGGPPVQPGCDL